MRFLYRDFYFRAPGSLVVLSFPQSLSFSSVFPSSSLKHAQVLERPVAVRSEALTVSLTGWGRTGAAPP